MPTVQTVLDRKGTDVFTIRHDATVLDAANLMNKHRIGALVVTDADKAVGIFTERDVLNRVVAEDRRPGDTAVGDVMSEPMACCERSTKLDECRGVMSQKKIRHLPVVEQGRLYGIISIGDLLVAEKATQESTIQYMNDYLHGRV